MPIRSHVKEQPAAFERFGARWTPTILMLDPAGKERHRIEGFLPTEEFLAQLSLGLGHTDFSNGRWREAEQRFRETKERHPHTEAAAEAVYWEAVSRYKATGDGKVLAETARELARVYPQSIWTRKGSVWA